jgi:hypothetical protein
MRLPSSRSEVDSLIAENLFLRKQLALFQERKAKPRKTTVAIRATMVALGRLFDW